MNAQMPLQLRQVALVGNPNAGKSALFNALTGARQKIANYPGVTVERKAGRLVLPSGASVELTDLPGAYGLHATSPDEAVTARVILGELPGEEAPGVLVLVLDAAKAAVPLWLAGRYFAADPNRDWIRVGMAGAAFLGHLYPIFSRFRGGKGVATALGAFLALEPKAAGLGFLTYGLAYGVSRISSVGSLCAVVSFPLWLYLVGARRPSYVLAGGLLLGIVATHRGNIARLWRGQEKKL